jgi:peptidyl-prolyl cis-trans isomerase C
MIVRRPSWRAGLAGAVLCAILPLSAPAYAQAPDADPVLVENGTVTIRRSDYEAELARLPPDLRVGFGNNEKRVHDLLRRMLLERTLAAQARAEKLDQVPSYATRLALEIDRLYAQIKVAQIEDAAAAGFEANRAAWEARAKEMYTVDRKNYQTPEMLQASHILVTTRSRSEAEARKTIEEARARVMAGGDFAAIARELSEDGSRASGGRLDWFGRAEMDRTFADAAFALANVGDVSQPVQTQFGWHIIRLEGRRPPRQQSFDEVRDRIMAELRQKYVADQRDSAIAKLRSDPAIRANAEAIGALVIRVDPEAVRRASEVRRGGSTPR